ncbi:MAG TPA: YihY/virulence factor BrkB family protein [Dongiaceae bacterium]|nr:YihY/virulence factor BrkB family protein [Dongiaceae bacterium]
MRASRNSPFQRPYRLLRATFEGWWNDRALSMGAAIAYYAVFSLAPVLLIVIAVGGMVFGADAARGAVLAQFSDLIGVAGAQAVDRILASAGNLGSGIVGTTIGVVTFLVTATGAFAELQADLNVIWKAPSPAKAEANGYSSFLAFVQGRLMTFALIGAISFLLMVSLAFDALASALGQYISLQGWAALIFVANLLIGVAMSSVLFAFIFKVLPTVPVSWAYVAPGAVLTAILFVIGKFAIGFYLGRSNIASSYGAAASVITLMLWIYYSAQILLFGAEFTKAYADRRKPLEARAPRNVRSESVRSGAPGRSPGEWAS